ncbi:uncharacterized protein LOC106865610 [Brachypodium distachyon]|uniref:uncharacterized protein LOC106865610 n=1 Tax=Brachypodium distachyon TaxID=15368 RepID=UPI000D0DE065|nr:uncharacterized protein LOC106865610 [Brachypodium distachyon]|eukprot:XP_024313141.1 uncharacterized protein LOC106865610 [Brachypodium distachyon]
MTGAHTFLSYPPNIPWNNETSELYHKYVLLTAADGIDRSSSFMLLVAELKPRTVRVQTFDGSCGVWGPVVACEKHLEFPRMLVKSYCEPAVLHGGVIHWLATHDHDGNTIPTYDIRSTKRGTTKLPPATAKHKRSHLHLGTSPEGKLLAIDGFMISVWLQLSDGGWGPEAVIDVEEKLRSLKPLGGGTGGGRGAGGGGGGGVIVFDCSGDRNANAVLLRLRLPLDVGEKLLTARRRSRRRTSSTGRLAGIGSGQRSTHLRHPLNQCEAPAGHRTPQRKQAPPGHIAGREATEATRHRWLHHVRVAATPGRQRPSHGGDWALEAVIDMEEKLRSLESAVAAVEFDGSGDRSADVVVLRVLGTHGGLRWIVLDLETMEMHKQEWECSSLLLEIDLLSRLQTMKIYP